MADSHNVMGGKKTDAEEGKKKEEKRTEGPRNNRKTTEKGTMGEGKDVRREVGEMLLIC